MSKLKHEIKQIEKATEFHNKKSDLQREEAMIKQQFEERKEIMDDISRLTGEYVALNNKKFKGSFINNLVVFEKFRCSE